MILVTGGTGLIGAHLLFKLVEQGEAVKATYRDKSSIPKVTKVFSYYTDNPEDYLKKIQWVKADITDLGSLEAHFHDVDYVYHSAALISFDPKDFNSLLKINVEGTANVVNLSLKHGIKQLCYVSSIAAIGSGKKGVAINEETEWNDTYVSVYGLSKFEAELEVWRGWKEGLPVVVVNPGIVLGPGFWHSGSGVLFKHVAKEKKSSFPGGTGFTSVNDVVSAMTYLMKSNISGERYILVNQNLSYLDVFEKIAVAMGVNPPEKKVPMWVLEFLWRMDFLSQIFTGKRRKLTKNIVKGLYNQENYDNAKSRTIPGFEYESLDDTIAFCSSKFKI
ncbi:NAD-dependent epimerase/dehydratase family protein [Flagellimonas allohymeniacidonis]|uniref:NAD-dependent epimerase/dehydratase family protein n=1 Tax=Flagellimonas allohymeniacidonis TaxID=2517819 RepID=A0A4V2HSJ0_9FLAO|nr:NAD-dependent epimerase/dehydratase family protein [Allomuricauda hymeniacidonis]TAI47950.1 NAD-dependent epimerase/dehydratase family protein [Allomuricauda hymeniacidonis]